MANIESAKKRVRRNARRTTINHARMGRIRTFIKRFDLAIEGGDKEVAQQALKAAQPEIMRGVTRGVLRKNTAARRMSRLNKRIKAIA